MTKIVTRQFLHGVSGQCKVKETHMKVCEKCHRPMISAGTVCGRVECSPKVFDTYAAKTFALDSVQKGARGMVEMPMPDSVLAEDAAPATRCFAYWDVSEDVAVLMASEISGHRLSYTTGRPARFWPNTEERHVNYRGKTVGGII